MKNSLLVLIAGFFLTSLPIAMGAGTDDLHTDVRKACQTDLDQFCKNVTPGNGREAACLKAFDDKISAGCTQELQNDAKKWDEFMQNLDTACSSDIDKLCQASVTAQDVLTCLTNHNSELTSACKIFSEGNPQVPT